MHRLLFSLTLTTSLLVFAGPLLAQNGYFGARGGISEIHENNIENQYNSVGFGSGYIGVYGGPFRAEAEYTLTSNAKYDEKYPLEAHFQRVMGNIYLDMPFTRYVRPYVGGGIGTAFYAVKDKAKDTKESGHNFAWNAGGGLGIKLTRNVTFDSGYRYINMGSVETKTEELNFDAHEVYAGLRFLF